jgi:hypothetical protein
MTHSNALRLTTHTPAYQHGRGGWNDGAKRCRLHEHKRHPCRALVPTGPRVRLQASEERPSASPRPAKPRDPRREGSEGRPQPCCLPDRQTRRLFSQNPRGSPAPKTLGLCRRVWRVWRRPLWQSHSKVGSSSWTVCLGRGAPSIPIGSRATAWLFNSSCVLLRCVVCFSLEPLAQESQLSTPGSTMTIY